MNIKIIQNYREITTSIKNCSLQKNWRYGEWKFELITPAYSFVITKEQFEVFEKLLNPEHEVEL